MAASGAARMRTSALRLSARARQHNLTLVAAGVAFYAFLAFVPALVAFISIYGLVADPSDVTQQVQDVASALPKEVQDFLVFQLTSIINANTAGVSITLIIAVLLALWSASGGMAALITGIMSRTSTTSRRASPPGGARRCCSPWAPRSSSAS